MPSASFRRPGAGGVRRSEQKNSVEEKQASRPILLGNLSGNDDFSVPSYKPKSPPIRSDAGGLSSPRHLPVLWIRSVLTSIRCHLQENILRAWNEALRSFLFQSLVSVSPFIANEQSCWKGFRLFNVISDCFIKQTACSTTRLRLILNLNVGALRERLERGLFSPMQPS